MTSRCDVAIIGGGIVGAATAAQLLLADPALDVLVVEPDPAYTDAATPRSSGGIRRLFSCPENIQLAQYTHEIIAAWPDFAGPDAPDLQWRPGGYLFIAGPQDSPTLQANLETQQAHGVPAHWLDPADLAARFPYLATHDLGGAVLCPGDGWLDPHSLLHGVLALAKRLGAAFRIDRAVGFSTRRGTVEAVELESGAAIAAGAVVDAAGCWAPALAAQVGMPVPVEPMRRLEHYVEAPAELPGLPFVKDPTGLAVRPEGAGLSTGVVDFDHPTETAIAHDYFDGTVWPALAHRIPALDELRLRSTMVGYYDQNRLDGNLIIGNRPGHADNFYLACGFSGHGLMQALGVGRALAELILHGEFRTIDLERLTYRRVVEQAPYPEDGIR